jgi:acetoin utilization protein AcuB
MIVREVMSTKLITVAPDDTLSHAANLLRQYQFHHLPVVQALETGGMHSSEYGAGNSLLLLQGLLTSHDIDLVVALGKQSSSGDLLHRPWQERHVVEVMHRASVRVTPSTSVAAAAQILVERGLNCLPVVEYEHLELGTNPSLQRHGVSTAVPSAAMQGEVAPNTGLPAQAVLVGLLTRSDLLMALARSMGAFEPGMQLTITLPEGDLAPLAHTLLLAAELHIQVRSVIAGPLESGVPRVATVRLGTINPAPLLVRLQEAGIVYSFADPQSEGHIHV